jgi:hypothetical protein
MPSASSLNRTRILVSFCCIYVFWGGTFLAMRFVGMGGILLAVFLVTSSKMKSGKPNVVDENLAVGQRA